MWALVASKGDGFDSGKKQGPLVYDPSFNKIVMNLQLTADTTLLELLLSCFLVLSLFINCISKPLLYANTNAFFLCFWCCNSGAVCRMKTH